MFLPIEIHDSSGFVCFILLYVTKGSRQVHQSSNLRRYVLTEKDEKKLWLRSNGKCLKVEQYDNSYTVN